VREYELGRAEAGTPRREPSGGGARVPSVRPRVRSDGMDVLAVSPVELLLVLLIVSVSLFFTLL
jgi:hypothetical protein